MNSIYKSFNKLIDILILYFLNLFLPFTLSKIFYRFLKKTKFYIFIFSLAIISSLTLPYFSSQDYILTPNNKLSSYIEYDFKSTNVPTKNPFGGDYLSFSTITAYYHDLNYYKFFKEWHTGLDIVPSQNYYLKSTTYKLYKQIIILATCNGYARGLIDVYGANYIFLKCDLNSYVVLFVHNKINFINKKEIHVSAGQPIAIMGSTGKATGPHLHYEVRKYNGYNYATLNPLDFINL